MDERGSVTELKVAVAALVLSVVLFLGAIGAGIYLGQSFSRELRDGLVEGCERNGNPLRAGLREDKEDELHVAEHPEAKVLKALHITHNQAIELAQPRIKKLKYDIHVRYAPVACGSLYPGR